MQSRCNLPLPLKQAAYTGASWPQTCEATPLEDANCNCPKITVITPSFNQAEFLETTIRSVLLQGYPNLEYFVVDGGSKDDSTRILEHYSPWLDWWESEPDRGQSHAINKGLARATGEIVCWLNSDDFYFPGTLRFVGSTFCRKPTPAAIVGDVLRVYTDGRDSSVLKGQYISRRRLLETWEPYQMHQPAIFWRRKLTEQIGMLDEELDLVMDFDYWVRLSSEAEFVNVNRVLAGSYCHPSAKTGNGFSNYSAARRRRACRYWGSPLRRDFWYLSVRTGLDYVFRAVRVFLYSKGINTFDKR